ncbi:MAG: DNA methylase [Dehalococcoidia bacterium]|nr:DNA methylase [Dehalococcoidia bacterium]
MIKRQPRNIIEELGALYSTPLPASRSGPIYSAFSYPTKISPESIAVFIASHTKPGDTVLDVFGGSGTAGIAAMLCSNPPPEVIELAKKLKAPVQWGPRKAILYELSPLCAFVAQTITHPPKTDEFLAEAEALITRCEARIGNLYAARDPKGEPGVIRYTIWTELIECPHCRSAVRFWDAAVRFNPLRLQETFSCPTCGRESSLSKVDRIEEVYNDSLLHTQSRRRRREMVMVYGRTGKTNWVRPANAEDIDRASRALECEVPICAPVALIPWGDLYRRGYHTGITHAHHFYTPRNWLAMATIWDEINHAPQPFRDSLKLLALSYNATHATLMTRVVVKYRQSEFVLTGAQTGVLYVSGLPVEKNLFDGLRRKAKTFGNAFKALGGGGSVRVVNASSRRLDIPDCSVDYVFTDPPFGDFIPYSEINFLNEVWLGQLTNRAEEVIVSTAQGKSLDIYGSMMADVFAEIARVLKDDGRATIVFHAAQADIWQSLQRAHLAAGFRIELASVLDKLQGSFKQVNSTNSVKGDPIFLLAKETSAHTPKVNAVDTNVIIAELMKAAAKALDVKERTPERLYSRFVALCMQRDLTVSIDAADFYHRIKELINVNEPDNPNSCNTWGWKVAGV